MGEAPKRPGQIRRTLRSLGSGLKIALVLFAILAPMALVFGLIFRLIFICGFNVDGC